LIRFDSRNFLYGQADNPVDQMQVEKPLRDGLAALRTNASKASGAADKPREHPAEGSRPESCSGKRAAEELEVANNRCADLQRQFREANTKQQQHNSIMESLQELLSDAARDRKIKINVKDSLVDQLRTFLKPL
jgi:hypothetical protein